MLPSASRRPGCGTVDRVRLRGVLESRSFLVLGVAASLVVPVLTLPRLPPISPWPVVLGLLPWLVGKYVLCPLRWWTLTPTGPDRRWHLRTFAEAELLGMVTPGHVGSDLWRVHRLGRAGIGRGDAVVSVGLDRLVGSIALAGFVAAASTALPLRLLLGATALVVVLAVAALVVRRWRPQLLPSQPLPSPDRLAAGLVLSVGYQLSIAALLLGILVATGNPVEPLLLLGAFGAAQLAGALPGPHGASPRDAALVVMLAAVGVPWTAAAATVALKAALAWLPALALGGVSLWLTRRPGGTGPVPRLARCTTPPQPLTQQSASTAW